MWFLQNIVLKKKKPCIANLGKKMCFVSRDSMQDSYSIIKDMSQILVQWFQLQWMVYQIFIRVPDNGHMHVNKPDFMDLYIMNPYIMI